MALLSKGGGMKAIRVKAFGDPEVLQLATVPDPNPDRAGAGPGVTRGREPGGNVHSQRQIRAATGIAIYPGSDGAGVVFAWGMA
jgi:NADPH:quinone reductase-like Zn-dependent oxidoreductase